MDRWGIVGGLGVEGPCRSAPSMPAQKHTKGTPPVTSAGERLNSRSEVIHREADQVNSPEGQAEVRSKIQAGVKQG